MDHAIAGEPFLRVPTVAYIIQHIFKKCKDFFGKNKKIFEKTTKPKNCTKKFSKNLKNPLTNPKICGIIFESRDPTLCTERWLSWSKAHDWKSCLG